MVNVMSGVWEGEGEGLGGGGTMGLGEVGGGEMHRSCVHVGESVCVCVLCVCVCVCWTCGWVWVAVGSTHELYIKCETNLLFFFSWMLRALGVGYFS